MPDNAGATLVLIAIALLAIAIAVVGAIALAAVLAVETLLGRGGALLHQPALVDLAISVVALRILAIAAADHRIDDRADDAAILLGIAIGLRRRRCGRGEGQRETGAADQDALVMGSLRRSSKSARKVGCSGC